MKYEILNRLTGDVFFVADIDCDKRESEANKKRLAVMWAIKNSVNLYGANLRGADLYGADLNGAKGVVTFCGAGHSTRFGFVYFFENKIMCKLGCFDGTANEAIKEVSKKYGSRSGYASIIRSAVKCLKEYHK